MTKSMRVVVKCTSPGFPLTNFQSYVELQNIVRQVASFDKHNKILVGCWIYVSWNPFHQYFFIKIANSIEILPPTNLSAMMRLAMFATGTLGTNLSLTRVSLASTIGMACPLPREKRTCREKEPYQEIKRPCQERRGLDTSLQCTRLSLDLSQVQVLDGYVEGI